MAVLSPPGSSKGQSLGLSDPDAFYMSWDVITIQSLDSRRPLSDIVWVGLITIMSVVTVALLQDEAVAPSGSAATATLSS